MFGKLSERRERKFEISKLRWICPKGAEAFSFGPGGCRYINGINPRSVVGACRDEINAKDAKTEDRARITQLNAVISFLKTFKFIERKAESGYYKGIMERIRGTPLDKAISNLEKLRDQIATGQRNI